MSRPTTPFVYLVRLIKQGIQRLEDGKNIPRMTGALRRLFHGAWGALCMAEGVRGLVELDFRHDCFETGYQNLKEAFRKTRIDQKSWYDWIQALNRAGLTSIEDPEKYAEFVDCFDELKQKHGRMRKKDRISTRFGMIDQLVMLVSHSLEKPFHSSCLDKLLDLAKRSECDGWAVDVEVFEALLDALCGVHGFVERKQDVEKALELMSTFGTPSIQKTFGQWLGELSLKDKLSSVQVQQDDERDSMFSTVIEEIKQADLNVESEFCEELKLYYESPDFAEVASLFDNEKAKHVESLKFSLVLYQKAAQRKEKFGEDQLEERHERQNMVRVPIRPTELFDRRKLAENGPMKEIHTVLAVGDPGTGKTSISKKLAYLWAIGKWGNEFQTVYVLPVRRLSRKVYDGSSDPRKATTLVCAIATILYEWRNSDEYATLCKHVANELKKNSTLLVLDGLDECQDACLEILNKAKRCACKLLMLSRPYNLHRERALLDFEVECLGLDDEQLTEFIKTELPKKSGSQFVSYLKANPSIWNMAHVPVTANILCVLWKEDSDLMTSSGKQLSLLALYKQLTQCLWKRYIEKYEIEGINRNDVFSSLGKIAFEALTRGEILISQSLVREHLPIGSMEKTLKASGFLLLQLEGNQYQFPHFTVEEFFAGVHLATNLSKGTEKEVVEARQVVSQNKYLGKYKVMLSFMAEEVRSNAGAEGCRQLLLVIDQEPRDITGWQHLVAKATILRAFFSVPDNNSEMSGQDVVDAHELMQMGEGILAMSRQLEDEDLQKSALRQIPAMVGIMPHLSNALIRRVVESFKYDSGVVCSYVVQQIPAIAGIAPHLSDALIGKLLEAFKDDNRIGRSYAVSHIPTMVAVAPQLSDALIGKLLEAFKDDNEDVRIDAVQQIPAIAEIAPQLSDALIGRLMEALKDRHGLVRNYAIKQIPAIAEIAPHLSDVLIGKLLEAFKDDFGYVRSTTVKQIPAIVGIAPQLSDALIEKLLEAFKDRDGLVRSYAVQQIPAIVGVAPQLSDALVGKLMEAFKDDSGYVRSYAVQQIPAIVGIAPQLSDALVGKLLEAFKDDSGYVRSYAVKQIPALVGVAPHLSDALIGRLMEALKDKDEDVRSYAVKQIPALVGVAPHLSDALIGRLMEALKDDNGVVRSSAVRQISAVVAVAPQLSNVLIGRLVEAFKERNNDVLSSAVEQIPGIMESIPSSLHARVIESLLALHVRDNTDIYLARRGLRLVPVEKLVDYFWSHQDPRLVPSIAFGFLKSSFVVATSNDDAAGISAVLTLKGYASDKKKWSRPVREIDHLVHLVTEEISSRHHALTPFCTQKPKLPAAPFSWISKLKDFLFS